DLAMIERQSSSAPSGDVIDELLQKDLPLVQARRYATDVFEQRYLERVLARHGGNVTKAAAAAGVARRHFQRLRARTK
ncbi:MAG: Response regulator of zinc sigma-54-dependent two-component system, partial [Labilithrix sp.]|nr:Response regulator of zinc sigma-54-dependent two-component system [Labilithrix sp.]